jgi:hypothetical protein
MLLTYVLHHRQSEPKFNLYVMQKITQAADLLFKDQDHFSQILMIGTKYKVGKRGTGATIHHEMLKPTEASDNYPKSYPQDLYESHIYDVDATGSVELAPTTGFYHFHAVLKITHWTKLALNVNALSDWFETAFTGGLAGHHELYIQDKDGTPFYKPTDHPHIDIRYMQQEDFETLMKMYAQKTVDLNSVENRRFDRTTQGGRPRPDHPRPRPAAAASQQASQQPQTQQQASQQPQTQQASAQSAQQKGATKQAQQQQKAQQVARAKAAAQAQQAQQDAQQAQQDAQQAAAQRREIHRVMSLAYPTEPPADAPPDWQPSILGVQGQASQIIQRMSPINQAEAARLAVLLQMRGPDNFMRDFPNL